MTQVYRHVYLKMIVGKTYFIYQPRTKYYNHAFYKGVYVSRHEITRHKPITLSTFDDVFEIVKDDLGTPRPTTLYYMGTMNFGYTEIYYNAEEIRENAKRARQEMEKRALDKILKRLVDPNFEWYI